MDAAEPPFDRAVDGVVRRAQRFQIGLVAPHAVFAQVPVPNALLGRRGDQLETLLAFAKFLFRLLAAGNVLAAGVINALFEVGHGVPKNPLVRAVLAENADLDGAGLQPLLQAGRDIAHPRMSSACTRAPAGIDMISSGEKPNVCPQAGFQRLM